MSAFVVADISSTTSAGGRILSLGQTGTSDSTSAVRIIPFFRVGTSESVGTFRNGQLGSANITYGVPFIGTTNVYVTASTFSNTIFANGTAGTTVTTTSILTYSNYGIGRDPGTNTATLTGNVYEVLVYPRLLSTTEQQAVEGYLASKWGLQANLPAGHGYKSRPPFLRPFVVTDAGTPQFWWDAAAQNTISASGSNLTTWTSRGSSVSNITVATGTAVVTQSNQNGLPVVSLSTSTQLQFTGGFPTQARARFIATRPTVDTTTTICVFLFQRNTGTGGEDFVACDVNRFVEIARGFTSNLVTGAFANQQNIFGTYTFINSSSSSSNYLSLTGTSQALTVSRTASNYRTTSTSNFINTSPGGQDLGEWISFNTNIELPQAHQIEGYLAWKWGVQSNLPVGHSCRFGPPQTFV